MADEPMQFAWPIQYVTLPDGTVTFAENQQDTDQDLKASAAVIAVTPKGANLDDPTFGVTRLLFQQGAIDTDRLADELHQADDRLDLDADELVDLADATRRAVNVNVG